MKIKKRIIITFILLIGSMVNCQVFSKDWTAFKSKNFEITCYSNISNYLKFETIGEMHVALKSDLTKYVIFYVFPRAIINDDFETQNMEYLSKNSCVNVGDNFQYSSHLYKGYYYLLTPFQNCETPQNIGFKTFEDEFIHFMAR